jgi:hypothetical protein
MLHARKTKDAQAFYGSRRKLAEALGVTVAAVSLWGDTVPELRQYQLEVLTRGKLKAQRHDGAPA